MATIRDVAREAGVSVGTVSMVLNNDNYGSEAIREKVKNAVDKLQYVPSAIGRNLSLQCTQIVGIIVPTVAHPFFSELVEGLEESLHNLGYKTMLCCTQKKENPERLFVEMLKQKTMDGIIMGAHSLDLSLYENINRPIIAFDRFLSPEIPIVHCDHIMGGKLAAQAFLKHSCHHIVEIAASSNVKLPAGEYHQEFDRIMHTNGIKTDTFFLPWNAFHFNHYLEIAETIFNTCSDIDGILGSDLSVAACMQVALKRGIKVPEQIKIVAYDGTPMTQTVPCRLTAIRQPIKELADLAARKIVSLIKNTEDDSPWTLPPTLLSGETC